MTMEYREVVEALKLNERKLEAIEELNRQDYTVELTDKFGNKELYKRKKE